MIEPEGDRVGAGDPRQLVHEAFDGEHVHLRAKPAQRRHAHRRRLDEVEGAAGVGQGVDRIAVARAAAFRHRQGPQPLPREGRVDLEAGQKPAGAGRPAIVPGAPHVVLPAGDAALLVERGLQLDRHRRAHGLPAVLLLAHPLQAHRLVGHGARHQRGIRRDIVGTVVAVAARALDMDATDLFRRQAEQLAERLA